MMQAKSAKNTFFKYKGITTKSLFSDIINYEENRIFRLNGEEIKPEFENKIDGLTTMDSRILEWVIYDQTVFLYKYEETSQNSLYGSVTLLNRNPASKNGYDEITLYYHSETTSLGGEILPYTEGSINAVPAFLQKLLHEFLMVSA
ncbi:MAG: hypothetical protein JRN26_05485 [Nitrososphaerota archaeon]|jgi:hypothetical protein|nr:hypothetical protein [Nitrososphaerota archaeon]MDG6927177.1 hypothetical protein [Nitrososphaerota archaeon]MDG6930835.1 hypothetical protein [Nitrososphaerota archaeon]MDG6932279.1 hypothetical protein [Nitrososphaerota archaeon]MDG6936316.1 hypothetical protein [Nitrososphaerota archaeon]